MKTFVIETKVAELRFYYVTDIRTYQIVGFQKITGILMLYYRKVCQIIVGKLVGVLSFIKSWISLH